MLILHELREVENDSNHEPSEKSMNQRLDEIFSLIEAQFREENENTDGETKKSGKVFLEDQCRRIINSLASVRNPEQLTRSSKNDSKSDQAFTSPKVSSIMVEEVPSFSYDQKQKKWGKEKIQSPIDHEFSKNNTHPTILVFEARFDIVHHRLLRHPLFQHIHAAPGANPQRDFGKETFVLVSRLVRQTINHEETVFVLGVITRSMEGRYFLEDSFAKLPLAFDESSKASTHSMDGYILSHAPIVVRGKWDGVSIQSHAIGLPPGEPRLLSRQWLGHKVDLFGKKTPVYSLDHILQNSKSSIKPSSLNPLPSDSEDPTLCLVFSDFFVDEPNVLYSFRAVVKLLLARKGCVVSFQSGPRFVRSSPETLIFVFTGNFLRKPDISTNTPLKYKKAFSGFAKLLELEFPEIAKSSFFFFLPGPQDLTQRGQNSVYPKSRLPSFLTEDLSAKLTNFSLATNPLRLRVCDSEIVIFRDETTMKMESESILPVAPIVDSFKQGSAVDAFPHVVKTVIDNSHLHPFSRTSYPVYPSEDVSLRLFPLPDTLVLCDNSHTSKSAQSVYLDCLAVNPGSFSEHNTFAILHPAKNGFSLTNVQDV
ncbi:hypothetical protein XU18_3500 [Perkinsela sp. CCAP 1560/4]|nr:hypothetical protein XU18_3500 [Perkinsela sp. CCAP 1560/4]|eukprot:KNH05529.1 hypothetical protein XU18_3500 [Perkinsela sp. CCAP 1560/4]